jgi:molybdopterin-guanine dinucleotide biosynthesis protein A
MPFLEPSLLAALHAVWRERQPRPDLVVPESEGPRGAEPLCAYYDVRVLAAIERAIEEDDARLIGFHRFAEVHVLPLTDVRGFGDPERMFFNVNTREDRDRAERMLVSASTIDRPHVD